MRVSVAFFLGFVVGFMGYSIGINIFQAPQPEVLAESTTATPSPTPLHQDYEGASSSSPTPSPSPSPTPLRRAAGTASGDARQDYEGASTPSPSASPTPTAPPAGRPEPTPDVWSPPAMEPMFTQYANTYGVDKNLLERIANCESHFNPNAVSGAYVGMFQFGPNTWINARQEIGFDASLALRTNIEESIRTAAYLVSKRGSNPWPSCI